MNHTNPDSEFFDYLLSDVLELTDAQKSRCADAMAAEVATALDPPQLAGGVQ